MNRSQKIAWWVVVCIAVAVAISIFAVGIMYVRAGFPKAWQGLGFLGISGLGGLAPLLFKKDPGPVQVDERDREIQLKAARAGFAMSYLVFGLLAMGIWTYCRQHGISAVPIQVLPLMFMVAAVTMFLSQSLATLLLYGRNNKASKGEIL